MEKEIRQTYGQVRALPDDDSRTVSFIISDESIDRHNSVIRAAAWDLEPFRMNPIAGWGHAVYGGFRAPNPDDIIGKWDVRIEGKELVGDLTFEDAETNPKAEKLFNKVRNGTLNAVSVGFFPNEQPTKGDEEKGEQRDVLYYQKEKSVELAEISIVPIPSNKNARRKAFENGDIPELIEELVREALGDKYNEKLTLKGLFITLRGGDSEEVEKADTGEAIDKESRKEHREKVKLLAVQREIIKNKILDYER
jgi:HK97 family phage prohead protease